MRRRERGLAGRRRTRRDLERMNVSYRSFIADDLRTIDTLKRLLHRCEAERDRLRRRAKVCIECDGTGLVLRRERNPQTRIAALAGLPYTYIMQLACMSCNGTGRTN